MPSLINTPSRVKPLPVRFHEMSQVLPLTILMVTYVEIFIAPFSMVPLFSNLPKNWEVAGRKVG